MLYSVSLDATGSKHDELRKKQGTYEKALLEACDLVLDLKSIDIIGPSPHTYEYKFNNETHFYIPDFYIPDLLLEIEVKDGGSNPNLHPKIQSIDKLKEKEKDKVMYKQHDYHYIKVVDKKHTGFIAFVNKLLTQDLTEKEKRDKIKLVTK